MIGWLHREPGVLCRRLADLRSAAIVKPGVLRAAGLTHFFFEVHAASNACPTQWSGQAGHPPTGSAAVC